MPDMIRSTGEDRHMVLGRSRKGRILVVVHTDHGNRVRIISARRATPRERRAYEQGP